MIPESAAILAVFRLRGKTGATCRNLGADLAIFPGNWTPSSHLLLLQTTERQTPAP